MMKGKLHLQIFAALGLAVATGLILSIFPSSLNPVALAILDFTGKIFMNLLKMIVIPLVATAIISGIAGLGDIAGFARLGTKTLAYYLTTTAAAVIIGLTMVHLIQPGLVNGEPVAQYIQVDMDATDQKIQQTAGKGLEVLPEIFIRMIPTNPIQSAANDDMLGLIFFSILFGYFITRLPANWQDFQKTFWISSNEVMMRLTDAIMLLAPIGIFALVSKVVATTGPTIFQNLIKFTFTVLLALSIHAFVVLPLLILLLTRKNPILHYKAMLPAILTAFSTASSSATLPTTLDCVERRAGVSRRTSGFVLPLGATLNMDGTALYECVAVLFISQATGIDLSLGSQFTVVLLAILTSIGVAGIPSASLVAIVIILRTVGLHPEGIGMILAVDRILDMCRTSVNVFGDSCGAVIIAHSEGEKDVLSSKTVS